LIDTDRRIGSRAKAATALLRTVFTLLSCLREIGYFRFRRIGGLGGGWNARTSRNGLGSFRIGVAAEELTA
jgi:hypothetical protein